MERSLRTVMDDLPKTDASDEAILIWLYEFIVQHQQEGEALNPKVIAMLEQHGFDGDIHLPQEDRTDAKKTLRWIINFAFDGLSRNSVHDGAFAAYVRKWATDFNNEEVLKAYEELQNPVPENWEEKITVTAVA